MSAKTIGIMNQKGGVGKSTIANLLAVALARLGYNVGLVDLDSQGHQAHLLGIFDQDGLPFDSVFNVFNGTPLMDEVQHVDQEKFLNIPMPTESVPQSSTGNFYFLSGHQQTATISPGDPNQLRALLKPLIDRCDYVIFDTGPTTSNLNVSALAASDHIIIPLKIGVLSFVGLRDLLNIRANLVNQNLVTGAEIVGLIPTMCRTNTVLYQELVQELIEDYGDLVWDNCAISESVVWEEAAAYQMTVLEHVPNHAAAQAGWELVRRFLSKFESTKEPEIG